MDREHLLLATTTGNKQIRFDAIAAKYDVVCYMGDNAGDLPLGTYGKDRAARNGLIDEHAKEFGTKYIVFPNPVYGAWVSAPRRMKRCSAKARRHEARIRHSRPPGRRV